MMDAVVVAIGVLVVLATVVDMILTVLAVSAGHGLVSQSISRAVWSAIRLVHRRRPRLGLLSGAGPIILLLAPITWGFLFLFGWLLVFWPSAALTATDPAGTVGWFDRFDFASTLIIGGSSTTVEAGGQPWSTIAGAGRFNGVALVSFGLAYALPVIASVVRLRGLARSIDVIGPRPHHPDGHPDDQETDGDPDVDSGAYDWDDDDWPDDFLLLLVSPLTALTQEIKAFPIVPFFHAAEADSALAPNLLALQRFLDGRDRDEPLRQLERPLQRAIDGLLDVVTRHFLLGDDDFPDAASDPGAWRIAVLEAWCRADVWDEALVDRAGRTDRA